MVNHVSIDERPAIVETRSRLGDWELNTIIGKGHQQAIVSLTERKSRLRFIHKMEQKTADNVSRAIMQLHKPIAHQVHTLTSDNGKEFAKYKVMAKALKARFCFAHSYA